ncbi:unnamed protein product [Nippostrongylus brasiliensis]|uniref:Hemicentin-1 (inferred by orthology to a human protein) n=1 Tax=Nippostrongylus brasiliensis TaxID=27835 RepID=A0A0N4Y2Z7_NIPBR|nr:unnamed protein product [Nippostrongylus brasiliensis]
MTFDLAPPILRLPTGSIFYEVPGARPPKVVGGVKNVSRGARVELLCPVFGYPQPFVRWEKDGQAIDSASVEYDGDNLVLTSADVTQSGVYSCIADNSFPMCGIEIDGKEVPVQYGEFTRLRDGGVFEAKIEKKKAKLDFGRSPAIVAGEYKCEVRSIEGSIAEGSMVIYSAPFLRLPTGSKFYEIPSASPPKVIGGVKRVHEGARVELRCPVFGYPEPYTRWEKDDEPVDKIISAEGAPCTRFPAVKTDKRTNFSEMSISVEYNGNDLILKDVDESMSGIYSCIADNSFQIYEDGPTIPHQLIYNQKLIVQFSNSLSKNRGLLPLRCEINRDGKSVPVESGEFTRLRDGLVFEAEIDDGRAKLAFGKTRVTVAGEYICNVSSVEGDIVEETIYVYTPPYLRLPDGVKFNEVPNTNPLRVVGAVSRIANGFLVTLTCPVFGFPEPHVLWEKNDKPIEPLSSVRYNGNQLVLYDADETISGLYSCIAENSYPEVDGGPSVAHKLIYQKELIIYNWNWIYR